MERIKQILSIVLVLALLISTVPTVVYAEENNLKTVDDSYISVEGTNAATGDSGDGNTENDDALGGVLEAGNSITVVEAGSIVASGECGAYGDNLVWTLYSSGDLIINGTGWMYAYAHGETPWYDYVDNITAVFIESGITSIGDYAFHGCVNLTSVTIPDSVTIIGDYAFWNCTSLTSVTIPDGITNIGIYVFNSCAGLTDITIPDSVTTIGYGAFQGCASLSRITIPDNVTHISNYAFFRCTGLTSLTIGDGVTSIYSYAFSSCSSLASVNIGKNVANIGGDAFSGCTSLISITIPDSVTSIGSDAFSGCTSLISITIPDSVTSIGSDAFSGCTSLIRITIPDSVTSIGDYAFWGCTSLTSITIPNNVTSIGCDTFAYCNSLSNIAIPDGVTSIGDNAFRDCRGLTSVTIPESVTSIGSYTFINCSGLTNVNIPNGVTSIGRYAFSGCRNLTSVTIPDSVTNIGLSAFGYCSSLTSVHISDIESWCEISFGGTTANPLYLAKNLYLNNMLVSNLVIPDNVTSIGNYAFAGCTSVASIVFKGNAPSIASDSFKGVTASVYYPLNNGTWTEDMMQDYGGTLTWKTDKISVGGYVRYFREWDAEKQIAYWGQTDYVGSKVTEDTDSSFLENVEDLIGAYVLVETQSREDELIAPDTLISVTAIETNVGTVSAADGTAITINGVSYLTPNDLFLPSTYAGEYVRYHIYGDELVGIEILKTAEGTLTHWNANTSVLVIDPNGVAESATAFILSPLADDKTVAFLGESGEKYSLEVSYIVDSNNIVYSVELLPDDTIEDFFFIGQDTNSFFHSADTFGYYEDRTGCYSYSDNNSKGTVYPTAYAYYQKLINGMNEEELLDKMNEGQWNGSCFGMALSMLWANTELMDIASLNDVENDIHYDANASYSDLCSPLLDLNLRDYINYCQLLQYTDMLECQTISNKAYYNTILALVQSGTAKLEWVEFWRDFHQTVVEANAKKEPVLLGYNYDAGDKLSGHAVLVCGYEETNSGYIAYQIYDCNILTYSRLDDTVPMGFLYMYVNPNDYGDFYFTQSDGQACICTQYDMETAQYLSYTYVPINSDNWTNFRYYSDISGADPSIEFSSNENSIQQTSLLLMSALTDNERAKVKFTVEAGQKFYLVASDGTYLMYDGSSYDGNMRVYDMSIVGEGRCELWFVIDYAETFTLSSISDNCSYSICTDAAYYTASAIGADTIVFTLGSGVAFTGEDYTFKVGMPLMGETGLMYIGGTCSRDSSTCYGDGEIVIETTGVFSDIKTEKLTPKGTESEDLEENFSSARVDAEGIIEPFDGSVVAVLGDMDNDGEISDWDAIILNRYLAGWDVEVELLVADVDGDGEVSDWDAIILERYLAGWNVKIG